MVDAFEDGTHLDRTICDFFPSVFVIDEGFGGSRIDKIKREEIKYGDHIEVRFIGGNKS